MAYFQVLKTDTEKTIVRREQFRDAEGCNQTREIYENVTIKPGAYGHEDIHVGDVLEIVGPLESKAAANREYFKKVKKTEEARVPNTKRAVADVEHGSREWLEQRQQFRRL